MERMSSLHFRTKMKRSVAPSDKPLPHGKLYVLLNRGQIRGEKSRETLSAIIGCAKSGIGGIAHSKSAHEKLFEPCVALAYADCSLFLVRQKEFMLLYRLSASLREDAIHVARMVLPGRKGTRQRRNWSAQSCQIPLLYIKHVSSCNA